MNEDYLKQIDELLAQGKTLDEVYDDIVFSEGFSGNEAALFQTIELKKKDSAAEEDSGLEDPSTQPAQPTISDLDPEDSGSSLQASQLELVDRAKSEIGNDYAFWLKNSLSSGDEMTSYEPEGDSILKKFTKGLGTHYMRAATDALGLDAISGVYDLQDIYAASSDFLFQKDGQEIRKDMPVPPQNTPAYKQWYNSLPPSAQADVAKPKDYLDFEFTPEQEQLADDAYAEIEKELFAVEGLAESMLSYKKTSREILQGELDSGEINQDEFMKGNDDINNDYLQRVYQNFMEEKGSDIVKKYIGEIDEGTDFAEAFSDKLFYEYGLDTDLDGDGIYNAQTYTGLDMEAAFLGIFSKTSLESADAELYRMGTGLESLVENSIDFVAESLGSDYASDEYFENQRAYINKRYEAESADATFVAKSLKDSLTPSQFDFTAAMTHSGNLVGTMLPLITATAIEEIATAGAATPVVAAQWAGLAARLGLTAARLGRAGKALSKVGKFTSEKLIKGAASEITYGVSSGAATYNSIADEEGWGNGALGTADKIVYSIVTGAGDYALSRLGKHGFRTASAQKYAQGMLRDGKILAASSNQFINRQLIKGFAMKRGLNLGGEALSEATTNASQYLIKADSKRESITLEELANEAIDGALSGIAVGGAFDVMGSTFGRAKAAKAKYGKAEGKFSDRVKAAFKAGAKYDIDFGNDLRVLKQDLKAFNDQLKNTKSKSERETLEKVIAKEEAKIKFIEAMGQPFYDMLSVRHPEVIEQLNEKDTEIAIVAAKYRAAKDGSPQEKALAGQLKVLVDQRTRIEAEYRSENKDYRLTGEEKLSLTDRKIEDKLTEMSDELELQKLAATERQNDGESVSESVKKEGEVTLSKQQQKVEEANEILSRYKEARKAKEEAESKGESEEKINELAESEGAVQQELLAYLDLDVRNGIVIKKDQAPFVDAATRKTDVWLNEALESLEDSGLTKEQITKLLKDKKVTALTAENPMNRDTDNATNESRNKEAEAWLKDQGLVYHKIIGKYEKGENSFLVEDMSVEQGIAFAKKFDQDSVAMPQGLVNQKGQVQLFEEGVDIDENIGDDFFSAIRDTEGNIVRFSLPLSDKYIDSDGKEITKDQYETVLEKDIDVDEETGEVKSTTVKAYKDGSYRIPEDAPGMTDPARKLLNVFMPIVEQMYPGAKLVIIHDADSADAIGKELGIENFSDNGGYWDGKGTVYVNPSAVDFNAKLENLEKKKTLEETILEETIHAILQPTIQGMDAKKLEGIRDELKEIIKNDLALTNRVEAKGSSYTKQGKGVKEVLEEEVVEILSAIVADPSSVNTTLISKIRAILNKIINTLGRKELTINSDSSAIKILHALNNASNLKVEAQAKAEAQDKASKRISPYSLKEQGPITVKYNKTIYKYSKGVKKDIGSRPDEKTFNGKWHFINWWKRSTDMGKKSDVFGFEVDGNAVDVETLTRGRSSSRLGRSSGRATEVIDRHNDRIQEAVKQGIITEREAKELNKDWTGRPTNVAKYYERIPTEEMAADPDLQRVYDEKIDLLSRLEEKSIQRIESKAKSKGKRFYYGPDEPAARASGRINTRINDPEDNLQTFYEKTFLKDYENLLCNIGNNVSCNTSRVTPKKIFFTAQNIKDFNINPEILEMANPRHPNRVKGKLSDKHQNQLDKQKRNVARAMAAEIGAAVSKQNIGKANDTNEYSFKGEDPRDFFTNHDAAFDRFADSLKRDGYTVDEIKQIKEFKPVFDIMMAITSNGSEAFSNNGVTMDLYARLAYDVIKGGVDPKSDGFISNAMVRFIGKQREFNKRRDIDVHYTGTRGDRKRRITEQLVLLNKTLKNYTVVNTKTGYVTIDKEKLLNDLSENKGRGYDNVAQNLFGSKLGNYMLSLMGNMDVLTQDSHFIHFMDVMKGNFAPVNDLIIGIDAPALRAQLENLSEKNLDNLSRKELMKILDDIRRDNSHPNQNKAKDVYKSLKGILPIDTTVSNRKLNEELADMALKVINMGPLPAGQKIMTKAVFGQIYYATSRVVYHKDYTSNAKMIDQLLKIGKDGQPLFKKASLEPNKQNFGEPDVSNENASKATEVMMGSGRLTRSSERQLELFDTMPLSDTPKVTDAMDSPLYRDRDHEEVLKYKGKILNDETELQALNTHATSRKIMEQNNQVNVGDRVGVRLNLNVLSNTGVPVQALHEITSTGNVKNVLKYGTAITIKNPTLFVNQDAREKIATFQDNKFPMASVNGEFVTSKIDEANFSGVKAIFNPHKSNVFTDVAGRPIKSAQEATVIGNNVFLRGNIEYYDFNDPIIMRGRKESVESKRERVKRGKDYDSSIKKFEIYMSKFGTTYNSRTEVETAYDNLSLESKTALDESTYAENLKDLETLSRASGRLRSTIGRVANTQQGILSDILNNPSAYIKAQNLSKVKDKLGQMSVQEITEVLNEAALGKLSERNDDVSVLAGIELFNRRMKGKDYDGAKALVEELAATGTTVGRMLRHFRELKTSNPEGMALMIKQEVARRNKKLSEEQEKRLSEMSKDLFDLHLEHEELMKRAIAGDDVEAELEAKTKEVKKKERELDTFTNTVIEKGWSEIGKQLIQGNLLTPMSQITNVGANMINAMGKVVVDAIALPIEKALNLIPGLDSPIKRNYSLNAYAWGVRKFGAGFVESLNEIATGQTKDVTEWRVQRGFAPIRSLLSALGTKKGEALPVNVGGKFREGKTSINHRAKLFVQGSFGIPAETMFRFLSLGDTPFRRGTEGIELYQIGKSKGLKGEALVRFMKYPDKKSRELAEREGRKLTFQERTAASQVAEQSINFLERMLGKGLDAFPFINGKALASFLVRASVPYVRTPANILMDTLTFVSPYVAGARIMGDLRNKDTRSAAQNFGKMMVGSMVTQTAMVLIKEGLISGEVEWDEDEEKNLAYDQFPPNSINISGLKRWWTGDSTEKREDDNFISYNKLGIPGTILGAMVKSADRDEIRARDYSDGKFIYHGVMDSFGVGPFSSISHMMDQSFLQGVNNFMDVLTSTDPDDFGTASERWLATTFKAASAMALPNTLSALHRAERTYMPDMRITKDMDYGERLLKRLEYIVKDRTFGATDIPVRVNWKGEPIKQNPRGNKGWVYQLLDITKIRKGEADPISQEMYRLYENTEAIPEVVGTPAYASKRKVSVPNLTDKKAKKAIKKAGLEDLSFLKDEEFLASKVYLNTEYMNQLMAVSGQDRYSAVARMMDSGKYRDASDYEKLRMLNKLNDDYKSAVEYDRGEFRPHTIQLLYMIETIYQEQYEED